MARKKKPSPVPVTHKKYEWEWICKTLDAHRKGENTPAGDRKPCVNIIDKAAVMLRQKEQAVSLERVTVLLSEDESRFLRRLISLEPEKTSETKRQQAQAKEAARLRGEIENGHHNL